MKQSKKASKKIVLTGGGTAGHVMPHIALLPRMKKAGWDIHYIGSRGIEKKLAAEHGIPFHQIPTGKLRRYLSYQNLVDVFRVLVGIVASLLILLRLRPGLVFSKGGFVSVPVAIAAWILRIPVVTHESDATPGLANRLIAPCSRFILCSFPQTLAYLPRDRSCFTGTPIREELRAGSLAEGFRLCGFDRQDHRPVLLIMGGSQGAGPINRLIQDSLDELLRDFRIIHLTGPGKGSGIRKTGYKSMEFAGPELAHLFAASDAVIGRAGANSIFEFLALKKPMLLIPLERGSRGDQIRNTESFVRSGWALSASERELTPDDFCQQVRRLYSARDQLIRAIEEAEAGCRPEQAVMAYLKRFFPDSCPGKRLSASTN